MDHSWLGLAVATVLMLGAASALVGARWRRQAARGPAPTRWVALLLWNGGMLALCTASAMGVWLVVAWRNAARTDAAVGDALAGLHDADPERRAATAALAGANGWADAREPLVAMLRDPAPVAREAAIRALGRLGAALGPAEIRLLRAELLTEHLGPAQAAHAAFVALGPDALPVLEEDLTTGSDDVRIGAAAALVAMGRPGVTALGRAANAPSAALRRAAVLAIGWHALDAGPWQTALGALTDEDARVRWTAAWAYRRLRPGHLAPDLAKRHLQACDDVAGATVVQWLGAAAGEDRWDRVVARELARDAGARPWTIRRELDAALADAERAPPLIPALRWLEPAEENAVPTLLAMLWRPAVRRDAVAALQAIGGRAVWDRLQSIASTPRVPGAVREACREALAGLQPPEPAATPSSR